MDAVANKLVDAVRTHGGRVLFRKEITRIILINGKVTGVETRTGEFFPAEVVIANLPEENIQRLTGELLPEESPYDQVPAPKQGWGAFVLYVGLDDRVISSELPLHHQILRGEPLGEGNSVFLSISPAWDESRAPAGKRAITLSTHTDLRPWWDLFQRDRPAYEARIHDYQQRLLDAARTVIPNIDVAAELVLPGTPVTFQRFTRRAWGWVGGYPQTSLFRAHKPMRRPGLWMVGDSIFPGQSVPAVALGGLRVADSVLEATSTRVSVPILANKDSAQKMPKNKVWGFLRR